MNEIQILIQKMEQILEKLDDMQSFAITEMAQRQGTDSIFCYYTLDREPISHYPHVHICIKRGTKGWVGKPLDNGSPYIDLGAIRLLPVRKYTTDDIILEHVRDSKIESNRYKKMFMNWLNTEVSDGFTKNLNCMKCLTDYFNSNPDCKFKDEYLNIN